MSTTDSLIGIFDFFIPSDVLSSVLLVFAMENLLDYGFNSYIPATFQTLSWILIYIFGLVAISVINYKTADEDELDELNDDLNAL